MRTYFNGLLTGLFLQLAIGPVFFFILGIILNSGFVVGFVGIVAVTIVDFLYISLSVMGISKLLEQEKIKRIFHILSSMVLVGFGIFIILSAFKNNIEMSTGGSWTSGTAFLSCFFLTVSSPLTILYWSGIFSVKAIENNYNQEQLIFFGAGAGSATLLFLSGIMFLLSIFRTSIPMEIIALLNIGVGIILSAYGFIRLFKGLKRESSSQIC